MWQFFLIVKTIITLLFTSSSFVFCGCHKRYIQGNASSVSGGIEASSEEGFKLKRNMENYAAHQH